MYKRKKKSLKYYQESIISECIHPELTDIDTNLKKMLGLSLKVKLSFLC